LLDLRLLRSRTGTSPLATEFTTTTTTNTTNTTNTNTNTNTNRRSVLPG
jgi:hypothetical protein